MTVTVRGTGLRSNDHVVVEVEQLLREPDPRGRLVWKPGEPLYGASLGPDAGGAIGEEPRSCYARGNTTGCVRVHIPRPQERPQLAVYWETFVRAPRLLVRLKAKNLTQRPERWMALRVYGLVPGQPPRTLAEWALAPNGDGVFDRHVSVVVGRTFSDVCVVASLSTREPVCPAGSDAGTVWAVLAVPALQ